MKFLSHYNVLMMRITSMVKIGIHSTVETFLRHIGLGHSFGPINQFFVKRTRGVKAIYYISLGMSGCKLESNEYLILYNYWGKRGEFGQK